MRDAPVPPSAQILIDLDDQREGLRIWREYQRAHDLLHVAENDWKRWTAQMEQLYSVPAGYKMSDITRGFERVEEMK